MLFVFTAIVFLTKRVSIKDIFQMELLSNNIYRLLTFAMICFLMVLFYKNVLASVAMSFVSFITLTYFKQNPGVKPSMAWAGADASYLMRLSMMCLVFLIIAFPWLDLFLIFVSGLEILLFASVLELLL